MFNYGNFYSETNWRASTGKIFINAKQEGLELDWSDRGDKLGEIFWKNGKKDGIQIIWYYEGNSHNGSKEHEISWKNGKKDGLEVEWNLNGEKEYEQLWKDGVRS
jgi:antitoxin component YwqK of YwqJK toxin-antitoxin module